MLTLHPHRSAREGARTVSESAESEERAREGEGEERQSSDGGILSVSLSLWSICLCFRLRLPQTDCSRSPSSAVHACRRGPPWVEALVRAIGCGRRTASRREASQVGEASCAKWFSFVLWRWVCRPFAPQSASSSPSPSSASVVTRSVELETGLRADPLSPDQMIAASRWLMLEMILLGALLLYLTVSLRVCCGSSHAHTCTASRCR